MWLRLLKLSTQNFLMLSLFLMLWKWNWNGSRSRTKSENKKKSREFSKNENLAGDCVMYQHPLSSWWMKVLNFGLIHQAFQTTSEYHFGTCLFIQTRSFQGISIVCIEESKWWTTLCSLKFLGGARFRLQRLILLPPYLHREFVTSHCSTLVFFADLWCVWLTSDLNSFSWIPS